MFFKLDHILIWPYTLMQSYLKPLIIEITYKRTSTLFMLKLGGRILSVSAKCYVTVLLNHGWGWKISLQWAVWSNVSNGKWAFIKTKQKNARLIRALQTSWGGIFIGELPYAFYPPSFPCRFGVWVCGHNEEPSNGRGIPSLPLAPLPGGHWGSPAAG